MRILRGVKRGFIFQALIAIALIAFLLLQVPLRQITATLGRVSPHWTLLGFLLFALADALRALRFRRLLKVNLGFQKLFPIVIIQSFSNTILPSRLGELSYFFLLRDRDGVSPTYGLASLFLARLADLLAIFSLFSLSVLSLGAMSDMMLRLTFTIGFLLALILAVLIYLVVCKKRASAHLDALLSRAGLSKSVRAMGFQAGVREVLSGLEAIRSARVFILTLLFSISIWILDCSVSYCLIRAVGLSLTANQVFYAALVLRLLALLPIHFLGGLGTLDVSWAFFLSLFGVTKQEAISSTLATHSIFYVYVFLLAAYGFYALREA